MFDFQSVPPADRPPVHKSKLPADQCAVRCALAVIPLCLRGEQITEEAVKRESPFLADIYAGSPLPPIIKTLGHAKQGLKLHREGKGKPFVPCRENAALALQALVNGLGPKVLPEVRAAYEIELAISFGFASWADFIAAIAALPSLAVPGPTRTTADLLAEIDQEAA